MVMNPLAQPDKKTSPQTIVQPESILDVVLQSAEALIPFDVGGMAIWDAERQLLFPIFKDKQTGFDQQAVAVTLKLGDGLIGWVAETHQPLYVPDIQADARFASDEQDHRSQLAVPILLEDHLKGVFSVESAKPNAFNDLHMKILQALASQAALVIETNHVYSHLRERYEQTEGLLRLSEILSATTGLDEMMDQALELTRSMLNVQAASILIYDRHESVLVPVWAGFGFPESFYLMRFPVNVPRSLLAMVFNTAHPRYVNDVSSLVDIEFDLAVEGGFSNLMIVPLRAQDHALGVCIAANRSQGFGYEEAQFLTLMGRNIAGALRNLDYLEQLRLFKGLSQVAQRVSAELASEQVLVAACQSVQEAIEGIDHVGIILNDQAPISGIVVAEYPLNGAIGQRLRLQGYRLYEEMVQSLSPVVVNDMSSAHELLGPNYDLLIRLGIKSLMVVPLVVQNEFIGSIGIDATQQLHQFTAAEIDVIRAIASQLAISVRNAQLFEELSARTSELLEANRLKSEFLAKMSHELRTPMNSILGFSDALLAGIYGDVPALQRSRMELIQKNGRSLLSLIDDLLDLSKIEAGRMELALQLTNVRDEVQICLQEAESQLQKKNLHLEFIAPQEVPPVMVDILRLRQVINNLLSNAIKFTRDGGITIEVELKTRQVAADKKPVQELWTSVKDSGIGIKPEHFEIIFDEFRQADGSTTREFGGTGLGLAISRRLIEMMKGRIWLESEIGIGSTFTFALPVAQSDSASAE